MHVQDGANSWAALAPWLKVISSDQFTEATFEAVRTSIIGTICKDFHRQRMDNTVEVLDPDNDYADVDLEGMMYHLRAIERRVDGNDYLKPTDENQKKVVEEFARTTWPKDKPPTPLTWWVVSWCHACFVLLCACVTYVHSTPHSHRMMSQAVMATFGKPVNGVHEWTPARPLKKVRTCTCNTCSLVVLC